MTTSTTHDFDVVTSDRSLGYNAPQKMARRLWLPMSLVVNLGILAGFKYCNFFADNAARLLSAHRDPLWRFAGGI